jgi:hypothetical protein
MGSRDVPPTIVPKGCELEVVPIDWALISFTLSKHVQEAASLMDLSNPAQAREELGKALAVIDEVCLRPMIFAVQFPKEDDPK